MTSSAVGVEVLNLARTTRKLLNVYFLFLGIGAAENITCYRLTPDAEHLVEIESFKSKMVELNRRKPNYEGATLTLVGCASCPRVYELYEETGEWYNYLVATAYEFYRVVNATVEHEIVISNLLEGPDGNGEWDAWTAPLLDGTAALNLLIKVPRQKYNAHYISRPVWYDRAKFITQPPKRITSSNPLHKLILPLSPAVWLGSLISIVCLFVVLEMLIIFRHQNRLSYCIRTNSHSHIIDGRILAAFKLQPDPPGSVVGALLSPVIDQGGITLQKDTKRQSSVRLLLSLWLAALIVLGSSYKSKVIEFVVLPQYEQPPGTFEQLATSHYGIYTLAGFSRLRDDFASLGKGYATELARRLDILTEEDDVS